MNYFQPWTSDKEPKLPKGWGLDAYRGRLPDHLYLKCLGCAKKIEFKEQYLYSYAVKGAKVVHNTKECWDRYNESS